MGSIFFPSRLVVCTDVCITHDVQFLLGSSHAPHTHSHCRPSTHLQPYNPRLPHLNPSPPTKPSLLALSRTSFVQIAKSIGHLKHLELGYGMVVEVCLSIDEITWGVLLMRWGS